jgi:hypothetical protein
MNETLRSLSLGAVHLFGVAVPGFLLIFLAVTGLLIPALAIALHISHADWRVVLSVCERNRVLVISVALLLSYVAGYILRLSTPDKLDQESAKHVLNELDEAEKNLWPYRGEEGDKFPYFYFREYLEERDLHHLAEHVKWGPPSSAGDRSKRSKTAVNAMKLDILLKQPGLSAVVDSNEAHIRLMSGTWLAIRSTQPLLIIGVVLCLVAIIVAHASSVRALLGLSSFRPVDAPHYPTLLVLNMAFLAAVVWARARIETLFHYRRVGELLFIVMAAHVARQRTEGEESNGDDG